MNLLEPAPPRPTRRRGPLVALLVVVVLALMMVVGGQLDRSETVATYRPLLPPEPFAGACDPFPDGVDLDLAFQLRADRPLTDPGGREVRRLDLHYDLVDEAEAERRVVEALEAGGFTEVAALEGEDPDVERWFELASYGRVGVGVEPFTGLAEDAVVRGRLVLDLPTSSLTATAEAECDNPVQTKRYPQYAEGDR